MSQKPKTSKKMSAHVRADADYSSYAFWCFTLSVALLPIGLGGDRPFSLGFAQLGISLACLFMFLDAGLKKIYFSRRMHIAMGLLAIVILWALIQTFPIVPEAWQHPVWQMTSDVLNIPVHGSISLVPEESLNGLTRLITYIAAGFLAYVLGQDPRRARQIVQAIWIVGTLISVYGFVVYIFGNQKILWFTKWAYPDDLTATFVNRNHFAIYSGMVLTSGVALLIQSWRHDIVRIKGHQQVDIIQKWLISHFIPQILLLVLVLVCILLSDSRAGFVLSLVGLSSYLFFYQIYLRAWRNALIIGIILFLVVIAAICAALTFSDHFAVLFHDWSWMMRSNVYNLALRAIEDNPWLGYGLNGFEPEFRLYQQNIIVEFNHAHSDVLESILDLGIPVGLILWMAIALMISGLGHGILHRRQQGLYPTLALAVSIVVLGHAFVDFDMQIPGVAITWSTLLGVGLAQSWETSRKKIVTTS